MKTGKKSYLQVGETYFKENEGKSEMSLPTFSLVAE